MAGETLPIDPVSATAGTQAFILGMMIMVFFMFIIFAALYVYSALALMAIAKKTKTEPAWLAWIPIANMVLLSRIAKMHWWPILLFVPALIFLGIGVVTGMILLFMVLYALTMLVMVGFMTVWYWKMFEAVKRPGAWALVIMISSVIGAVFNYIPGTVFKLTGVVITFAGTILFLVFLGVAAWGNPAKAEKAVKKGRKR